jgi:hypothetical protein
MLPVCAPGPGSPADQLTPHFTLGIRIFLDTPQGMN